MYVAVCCFFNYRDKEMHYKGVQKQNILQSVHDASSIHALLTSKQVHSFLQWLRFCL